MPVCEERIVAGVALCRMVVRSVPDGGILCRHDWYEGQYKYCYYNRSHDIIHLYVVLLICVWAREPHNI